MYSEVPNSSIFSKTIVLTAFFHINEIVQGLISYENVPYNFSARNDSFRENRVLTYKEGGVMTEYSAVRNFLIFLKTIVLTTVLHINKITQ